MSSSDILTVGTRRPRRVRDIDFRRPMKFTGEHLRVLEHAHETFCRSASTRMSAELRGEVQLSMVATDQLPYSVVMAEEIPRQALVILLRLEPLNTNAALVLEIPLAKKLVNRVLGGRFEPPGGNDTSLTELEMAVAVRSLYGFVDTLSTTWSDLCGVSFDVIGGDTSPSSVQLVPPSEPTLLLTFSAELDSDLSVMTLVLPHRSLETVIDQLSYHKGEEEEDDPDAPPIRRALSRVKVKVSAEAGSTQMPVADVLALQPGDIIRLDQATSDGISVLVGDRPVYRGEHGAHNHSMAVQITGKHTQS